MPSPAWALEDDDLYCRAAEQWFDRVNGDRWSDERGSVRGIRQSDLGADADTRGRGGIGERAASQAGSGHSSNRVCGCAVQFLPPYSPDLNPIELAFAKLRSLLRKEERTIDGVCSFLGQALDLFGRQSA